MSRFPLAVLLLVLAVFPLHGDDWPQWRGPDRSNVSKEKGLLAEWQKDGPALAWKAEGLGDGVAPVSVSKGRVFTIGNIDGKVVCTAISETDGKKLWSTPIGPAARETSVMRWLAQTSPTVDGERIYAVTANGDYACLASDTGKEIWTKHFEKDFGGKRGTWGFCDYPLVDGDTLIICPGAKAPMAALNKKTGEVIWTCTGLGANNDTHSHSVLIAAEIAGTKQYIVPTSKRLISVSAADGKLLWVYEGLVPQVAATHAPVVQGDSVFYASGYAAGHVLLDISKTDERWSVKERYREKNSNYVPWLGSPTRVGDRLFITSMSGVKAFHWKNGEFAWDADRLGRSMYTIADGKLYIRTQKGEMILATADADDYKAISTFKPPRMAPAPGAQPAWTYPVVANGRLYIRDYDLIHAYDIRADVKPKDKKVPDAVFVPTPPDVVARMLELAAVKKDDVLYDLGSGDGRIVIAAAKSRGCKAVGIEIDQELVQTSRDGARNSKLHTLATFEHADLFEADFAKATVVAVYILPEMLEKLKPKFAKLKAGTRIVSHNFPIPDMKPDKVVKITSTEDDVERPVYLYTVPLIAEKKP